MYRGTVGAGLLERNVKVDLFERLPADEFGFDGLFVRRVDS